MFRNPTLTLTIPLVALLLGAVSASAAPSMAEVATLDVAAPSSDIRLGDRSRDAVTARDRVTDRDNIIRIHGIHSRIMRQHYKLYVELMRGPGPLTRIQREMIAVVVSTINGCHY